jgi:hypothetical protein
MRSESHAAMTRVCEQKFSAEKRRIAQRKARLDPVHTKLAAALRKVPELADVVRAIDALGKPPRPAALAQASRSPFAPKKNLARHGSIQIVDVPPYPFQYTWFAEDGTSNQFFTPPTADPTTGNMGFWMVPGQNSSGHMQCAMGVGCSMAIPNTPCIISFSASPAVSWSYDEVSTYWRQAAGTMWVGLYVNLFAPDGSFVATGIEYQSTVASFDDVNLGANSNDAGSTSGMFLGGFLSLGVELGLPIPQEPVAAKGGFMDYWCWIGGSANCDGSNDQSFCDVQMNVNCSSLSATIFEF